MAAKGYGVILGYIDEQINSKDLNSIDFTCNKIGGKPEWCAGVGQQPICSKCKKRMLLVAQIYAPLEGNLHHRVLHTFACITPECWNRPHSWVCLRSQFLDTRSSKSTSNAPSPKAASSEMWLSDQEDWGSSDDDDDDGNGNTSNFPFVNHQQQQLDNEAKQTFLQSQTEMNIGDNLNKINANTTTTIAEMAKSLEAKINLNEDDSNANEAVCGAVAMQRNTLGGMEASALIEGPEGDMIAVESPERPSADIPALFKEATRIEDASEVNFISFYVSSDAEPPEETGFSEHERELFLRYTHSSGQEFRDEDGSSMSENQGEDGVYEKAAAHHGDILIHKFKKRIMRSPQQILRYCREEGSSPLWLYPPPIHDIPARCSHCSGRLVFEMQIMPQVINCLRVPGISGPILEFGTIVIYTCSSSCWREGDMSKQEVVVVQGEAH